MLASGMMLCTFILLKLSVQSHSLPQLNSRNELSAMVQGDVSTTNDANTDEDLSGNFEEDFEGEAVLHDFVIRKSVAKKKRKEIWEINLNHTSGKHFLEGDMRLGLLQELREKVDRVFRTKRAARPGFLWKFNTIYYKIDNVFSRDTKIEIKRGIKHWKRTMKNCLKFIRLDKNPALEKNISRDMFDNGPVQHILFTKDEGCWSQVGRTDTNYKRRSPVVGQQIISIGAGCGEKGTVIHEIGHSIGFWHEQSRRDRDKYIRIVNSNIIFGQDEQFGRRREKDVNSMGYAYDFWSVMHYGSKFFSKNRRHTIKIRNKYRKLKPEIGQRNALSYLDVAQVRAMYKCNVIPSPESSKTCIKKSTKGRDYRGKLDYTEKGVMCQPWYKQYPHTHKYDINNPEDGLGRHNHCRNPGGEKERPWCFTTLGGNEDSWQYCDIKRICDS